MAEYTLDGDTVIVIPNASKLDDKVVVKALEEIRAMHRGELRPEYVVAAASDPKHALHQFFEWNDAKAAHAHRLDQARAIIRIVRIEVGNAGVQRAYISLNSDHGGRSYHTISDVISSAVLKQRLEDQAEDELQWWTRRYQELKEIVALVAPAQTELAARRQRRRKVEPTGDNRPAA